MQCRKCWSVIDCNSNMDNGNKSKKEIRGDTRPSLLQFSHLPFHTHPSHILLGCSAPDNPKHTVQLSRDCNKLKIKTYEGILFHSQEWSAILFSFSLSPKIYHTVWRTWHLIACSDESWFNYQFSLHHSYLCSWMVRRICIMSLAVKGLTTG